MDATGVLSMYGESAKTALGFFWKAGWAFVLGYGVSAMIQTFVPKARLTKHMGHFGLGSLGLATGFGAISSSCSFAALSAARALLQKGAHFTATVAFMFASTNLVIELGILILIFLGWQYLAAEIIGGLILIAISSLIIRGTMPARWADAARENANRGEEQEDDDFSPWKRMTSRDGWRMVGKRFFMEWKMVWEEILIGFTIAGFMAVLVPATFWQALFLSGYGEGHGTLVSILVAVENAMVAPFVAAATFIGSMGNIPLATVLNSGGVLFAGIIGFIYSDLMVPPLVNVNAKYYGWRAALYIAGVMYISIVCTALLLHFGFGALGITPESGRAVHEVAQFKLDYTLVLNGAAVIGLGVMAYLAWGGTKRKASANGHGHGHEHGHGHHHDHGGGPSAKRLLALAAALILAVGLAVHGWQQWAP